MARPDYGTMTDEKHRLIDLLLDREKGGLAVHVYHGRDPGELRDRMRTDGVIEDDEVAEATWEWVAESIERGENDG